MNGYYEYLRNRKVYLHNVQVLHFVCLLNAIYMYWQKVTFWGLHKLKRKPYQNVIFRKESHFHVSAILLAISMHALLYYNQ